MDCKNNHSERQVLDQESLALAGAPRQNFAFVGWLLIGRSSNVGSCVMSDAESLVHTPSKNLSAFAPSKYVVNDI